MAPVTEPSPKPPKLVLGPLSVVAVAGLWRGLRRRNPLALGIGVAAAVTEFSSSGYARFKRRWTLFSITDDT
jgi:MYXO-CTERM domain-containing protein